MVRSFPVDPTLPARINVEIAVQKNIFCSCMPRQAGWRFPRGQGICARRSIERVLRKFPPRNGREQEKWTGFSGNVSGTFEILTHRGDLGKSDILPIRDRDTPTPRETGFQI